MRSLSVFAQHLLLAALPLLSVASRGQSCTTGLCLQQISCPNGGTTTITGTVYAPNNTDPLPGVIVYIPNAAVAAYTPGVTCAVAGQAPSGSPLVGTTTATDGTFTLSNVPVGNSIPLVIQSGRWRRQVVVPSTAACTNTAFRTRLPQTRSEGDIPKIAVVTGSQDSVECVLRKVGIADTEFTDASASGRVNLFTATGSPGVSVDAQTPTADALIANQSVLNDYDVLMLPCEGASFNKAPGQLSNLLAYADAGGRVYASHFSYDWLVNNGEFNTVVNWDGKNVTLPNGTATVNTTFSQGAQLSAWLGVVGASTSPGQIAISTLRQNFTTVNAPTQAWLTLNDNAAGNPIMQFTFHTPVGAISSACGRVLYNEYHVEDSVVNGDISKLDFPAECSPAPMTAQEKLLEYNLFDLTGNGFPPSLTPLSLDFGSEPVGFSTPSQKFIWTNNTFFPVVVSAASVTGDFAITKNACATVSVGGSCEIDVDFTPTFLGARTGSLNVVANTGTLTATLSGTGISPLVVSSSSLGFGLVDVGASVSQTITLSNTTTSSLALARPAASGDFVTSSSCSSSLAAQSSCIVMVTFTPSTTGTRSGSLSLGLVNALGTVASTNLTGTGVDFIQTVGPTSAQTIAGLSVSTTGLTTPMAGFANQVTVTCTTIAPGSTCTPVSTSYTPLLPVTDAVKITTTSQYAVVGFAGVARGLAAALFVVASGLLLLLRRFKSMPDSLAALRIGVIALFALTLGLSLSGCSGKQPALNTPYTPAGTYSYTVTATDGFLKHSATYSLVVTAQ